MFKNAYKKIRNVWYSFLKKASKKFDDKFYFLGFETKVCPTTTLDLMLKFVLCGKHSHNDFKTFWKIVDFASKDKNLSYDELCLKIASEGLSFEKNLSEEAEDYVLTRAFRRGISAAVCHEMKDKLGFECDVDFSSMYANMMQHLTKLTTKLTPLSSIAMTPMKKPIKLSNEAQIFMNEAGDLFRDVELDLDKLSIDFDKLCNEHR